MEGYHSISEIDQVELEETDVDAPQDDPEIGVEIGLSEDLSQQLDRFNERNGDNNLDEQVDETQEPRQDNIPTVRVIPAKASKQPLKVGDTFAVLGGVFEVYAVKDKGRVWANFLGWDKRSV